MFLCIGGICYTRGRPVADPIKRCFAVWQEIGRRRLCGQCDVCGTVKRKTEYKPMVAKKDMSIQCDWKSGVLLCGNCWETDPDAIIAAVTERRPGDERLLFWRRHGTETGVYATDFSLESEVRRLLQELYCELAWVNINFPPLRRGRREKGLVIPVAKKPIRRRLYKRRKPLHGGMPWGVIAKRIKEQKEKEQHAGPTDNSMG